MRRVAGVGPPDERDPWLAAEGPAEPPPAARRRPCDSRRRSPAAGGDQAGAVVGGSGAARPGARRGPTVERPRVVRCPTHEDFDLNMTDSGEPCSAPTRCSFRTVELRGWPRGGAHPRGSIRVRPWRAHATPPCARASTMTSSKPARSMGTMNHVGPLCDRPPAMTASSRSRRAAPGTPARMPCTPRRRSDSARDARRETRTRRRSCDTRRRMPRARHG